MSAADVTLRGLVVGELGGCGADAAGLVVGYAMAPWEEKQADLYLQTRWAELADPVAWAASQEDGRLLLWLSREAPGRLVAATAGAAFARTGNLGLLRLAYGEARLCSQAMSCGLLECSESDRVALHYDIERLGEAVRFGTGVCSGAAEGGSLDLLRWARAVGLPWGDHGKRSVDAAAAKAGRLDILQWVHARGCPLTKQACAAAARGGHLEVLKWLHQAGCEWDEDTCAQAAKGGHLEVLAWARKHKCPWDSTTCAYAARKGHLGVLRWARSCPRLGRWHARCPWDVGVCAAAAQEGRLEALRWLRSEGCAWDEDSAANAAEEGHLETLRWAVDNGCPAGAFTCAVAARRGQLEALKLLRERGCAWDGGTLRCALEGGHASTYEWALANGCPREERDPPVEQRSLFWAGANSSGSETASDSQELSDYRDDELALLDEVGALE